MVFTSPDRQENGLTPKEELFCYHYVQCYNGNKAARHAGLAKTGARSWAAKKLRVREIQDFISKLQDRIDSGDVVGVARDQQLMKLDEAYHVAIRRELPREALAIVKEQNLLMGLQKQGLKTRFKSRNKTEAEAFSGKTGAAELSEEELGKIVEVSNKEEAVG